jgi:hypothetical protein
MEHIKLKYRSLFKGLSPKPIKLEIPGWAGEPNKHTNGDMPQPWHCPPFIEASTYGLELYYPFETECRVKNINDKIIFDGDFSKEKEKYDIPIQFPPFMSFAPNHFGMTSGVDIQVPKDFILRTEPHPRFYTDSTNTVPCCISGHLQTNWWPKIFFVVFKNPIEGQELIFRKSEPYAQILILPRKAYYQIDEMTNQESNERIIIDKKLEIKTPYIIRNSWRDHLGQPFDDKYKQLSVAINRPIDCDIKSFLDNVKNNKKSKVKRKLLYRKK